MFEGLLLFVEAEDVSRFIRSNLVSRKPLKKDADRLVSANLISAQKST